MPTIQGSFVPSPMLRFMLMQKKLEQTSSRTFQTSFLMFEGDITYVDEALYANKLSVVYDDLPAARETMD